MVTNAKENYYKNLGRKFSNPNQGTKAYWSVFNRLLNKKNTLNISPLLESGVFVTDIGIKADRSILLSNAPRYQLKALLLDFFQILIMAWTPSQLIRRKFLKSFTHWTPVKLMVVTRSQSQ